MPPLLFLAIFALHAFGPPLFAWLIAAARGRGLGWRWVGMLVSLGCAYFEYYRVTSMRDYGVRPAAGGLIGIFWSSPWLAWALYRTARPKAASAPTRSP